ncbi:MAG: hypothetical protein BGN93_14355 [Acinetobacter sp. 39-4]|nr:MAG: hypothetical protein BGN93_14355 [Acinetobacter sp. 39-4]
MYQLQRHSDHHAYPTRSYQALRHYKNVPQLPAGYTSLFLQVFIPSYWFSIMDKQVINYYQGDIDKINVYEPAKETVLQKYNQYFQAQATEAL